MSKHRVIWLKIRTRWSAPGASSHESSLSRSMSFLLLAIVTATSGASAGSFAHLLVHGITVCLSCSASSPISPVSARIYSSAPAMRNRWMQPMRSSIMMFLGAGCRAVTAPLFCNCSNFRSRIARYSRFCTAINSTFITFSFLTRNDLSTSSFSRRSIS
jgi:hypothetical protein